MNYFSDRRFGNEMRSFGAKTGSGLSEGVIGKVAIDDESHLNGSDFASANTLWPFGFLLLLLPHFCRFRSGKKQDLEPD